MRFQSAIQFQIPGVLQFPSRDCIQISLPVPSLISLIARLRSSGKSTGFNTVNLQLPIKQDEVVQGGRHSDNGLKADGFKRVVDKIAPLITDATIDVKKVKNRTRTLKDNFVLANEAIAQSGFNLSEDGRVMADEEVWIRYIEAHPKASILRGTKVHHFEKLQIIFGNDQAIDEFAIEGNDSVPQTPLEYIDIGLDESQTVGNGEGEFSHGNAPRTKGHMNTSSLPPKRRRSLDVFEQFGTALSKMADYTEKLVDAFQKEPVKPVLLGVMNALKAIPELTTQERVRALHKMGAQRFLVDVFFAMDEENRFEWVKSDLLYHVIF